MFNFFGGDGGKNNKEGKKDSEANVGKQHSVDIPFREPSPGLIDAVFNLTPTGVLFFSKNREKKPSPLQIGKPVVPIVSFASNKEGPSSIQESVNLTLSPKGPFL